MSEEIKPYSEIQEAKVEKVKSEIIAILTTRITTTALVLIPSFIFSFKNNPSPDNHYLFHLAYYGCYLNILLLFSSILVALLARENISKTIVDNNADSYILIKDAFKCLKISKNLFEIGTYLFFVLITTFISMNLFPKFGVFVYPLILTPAVICFLFLFYIFKKHSHKFDFFGS